MSDALFGALIIACGLWIALSRKRATSDLEDYQRAQNPKMRPYTAACVRSQHLLRAIFGVILIVLGVLKALGLLSLER